MSFPPRTERIISYFLDFLFCFYRMNQNEAVQLESGDGKVKSSPPPKKKVDLMSDL